MKRVVLTKREQFALEAMKSLIAKHSPGTKVYAVPMKDDDIALLIARGAVDYADALIKSLKEKPRT